jgi:hypothetical protein
VSHAALLLDPSALELVFPQVIGAFDSALSDDARSRLAPHLELVSLQLGDAVRHVYFPTDSILSLLSVMENEASAEISAVGYEGVVGIVLNLGARLPRQERSCRVLAAPIGCRVNGLRPS